MKKLESLKGNLFNDFEKSRISGQSIYGGTSDEIATIYKNFFDIDKDGKTIIIRAEQ